MPRAFTPTETDTIRERLLTTAADSFVRRGLRGTTVEALADEVGISKGAFYAFYPSKEALFRAVVERHEARSHAEIEAAVRRDPAHGVDTLLGTALGAARTSPLVEVAMSAEGRRLLRAMTPPEQEAFLRRDEVLVRRVLDVLAAAGVELQVSPTLLLGLLRSLVFLGWHRDDVGPDLADEVAGWLRPLLRDALLDAARP